MVVLGIVLIVLAVLLGLGIAVSSTDAATMTVYGVDFGVIVPTVFFLGAAAGIALAIGLWLTKKGLSRGYRKHKEMKELRKQAAVTSEPGTREVTRDTDATREVDTTRDVDSTRDVDTTRDAGVGRHAAPADTRTDADLDTRTGPMSDTTSEPLTGGRTRADGLTDDERAGGGRRTVADGTDTRQPH